MNELQFLKQKFQYPQYHILPPDTIYYILSFLVEKTDNGFLFDEKQDGIWKYWDEDLELWWEESWKDGKKDGIWEYWNKDGKLYRRESWKDGKKDGIWKSWFEDGKPSREESWKDEKRNGICKSWYRRNGGCGMGT